MWSRFFWAQALSVPSPRHVSLLMSSKVIFLDEMLIWEEHYTPHLWIHVALHHPPKLERLTCSYIHLKHARAGSEYLNFKLMKGMTSWRRRCMFRWTGTRVVGVGQGRRRLGFARAAPLGQRERVGMIAAYGRKMPVQARGLSSPWIARHFTSIFLQRSKHSWC